MVRSDYNKMPSNLTNFNIRDVWKNNMEEEFAKIREIVENYPYVAMVRLLKCVVLAKDKFEYEISHLTLVFYWNR